jgi:hypothetical protein
LPFRHQLIALDNHVLTKDLGIGLIQRAFPGGAEEVGFTDIGVGRVDQHMLEALVEKLIWIPHEILVERIIPGNEET